MKTWSGWSYRARVIIVRGTRYMGTTGVPQARSSVGAAVETVAFSRPPARFASAFCDPVKIDSLFATLASQTHDRNPFAPQQ
jgi:hypothetical protein